MRTSFIRGLTVATLVAIWPALASAQTPFYTSQRDASATKLVMRNPDGIEQVLYSESHALLIGNITYAHTHWRSLEPIRPEILLLKDVLEEQGFKVQVHFNLVRADLTKTIDDFVREHGATTGARLLIYFAGHGYTRDIGGGVIGYILPVDAPPPNAPDFTQRALSMSWFEVWARTPEARHMLFVFDSCFAGSIFGNLGRGDPPGRPDIKEPRPKHYVFSQLAMARSRQFIAAGTGNQTVPANSIFTKLLAQALRGLRPSVDVNWDGFVTGLELANYLIGDVPSYYGVNEEPQTPQYGKIRDPLYDIGDMVFRLPERSSVGQGGPIIAARPPEPRTSPQRDSLPPPPATPVRNAEEVKSKPISEKDQQVIGELVEKLTSPVTVERRKSRDDLARFLTQVDLQSSSEIAAQLVRALPNASYRYQLGVATALAKARVPENRTLGWVSSEPNVSTAQLDRALMGVAARDPSLRNELRKARQQIAN